MQYVHMLNGLWRVTERCGHAYKISFYYIFIATVLSCRLGESVTASAPMPRIQSVHKVKVPAARLTKRQGRLVRRETAPTQLAEVWPRENASEEMKRDKGEAEEFDYNLNRSKLFIIMTGERPESALKAQASWVKHVHWPDKAIFACGAHCRKDGRLESVLIAPNLMLFDERAGRLSSDYQQARLSSGPLSSDYKQAQMRGLWALKWAWHNVLKTGSNSHGEQLNGSHGFPAPARGSGLQFDGYGARLASESFKWWIIGDDDTFFNLPVLNRVLERYNWNEPYVLAQGGQNGGCGIVMSLAAAKIYVSKVWPSFQSAWRNTKLLFFYDGPLISAMKVMGAEIRSVPEFTQRQPDLSMLSSGRYKREFAAWHHAWEHHILPNHYEAYIYGSSASSQKIQEIPLLKAEEHGCNLCCNDGDKNSPCVDLTKCAERGPKEGKFAFVLTQAGPPRFGKPFLPNIDAMLEQAKAGNIDILFLIDKTSARNLNDEHKNIMNKKGINVKEVEWAVPPDMRWTRPSDWCGLQDFIRLHVLGLEGYDAVAYYDSDVEIQGDVRDVFRCAASGIFLSTSGGIGEPFNVGFFAVRPDPRLLTAARIFARRANFSEQTGWGESGWAPAGGYYVGGECGQGFFHQLFYKKSSTMGQMALKEAGLGAPGAFVAGQIDRCVWNYQTDFQCKENFDCSRVRAHHKPARFKRDSNAKECKKRHKTLAKL